jgi:hypothetical protein
MDLVTTPGIERITYGDCELLGPVIALFVCAEALLLTRIAAVSNDGEACRIDSFIYSLVPSQSGVDELHMSLASVVGRIRPQAHALTSDSRRKVRR